MSNSFKMAGTHSEVGGTSYDDVEIGLFWTRLALGAGGTFRFARYEVPLLCRNVAEQTPNVAKQTP